MRVKQTVETLNKAKDDQPKSFSQLGHAISLKIP